MYLQLAEPQKNQKIENPFVYVPSFMFERYGIRNPVPGKEGMFIREDWFDNLDPLQWKKVILELSKYQPSGVSESEHLASRADRKAKRKGKKETKLQTKKETRDAKKDAQSEKREDRKEKLKGAAGIFGTVLKGVASSFLTPQVDPGAMRTDPSVDPSAPALPDAEKKPWYKTTGGMIGIGAGTLVLIGGIWYATKPKK